MEREQIINFLLASCDVKAKRIAELEALVKELESKANAK